MIEEKLHIYVDESGNTNLSDSNVDLDHYVIVALLLENSRLEEYESLAKNIVDKHAPGGELKSSSIGSNKSRRTTILTEIAQSGFNYYALVVDKSKIWRDSGLRYKSVFYKFLHRMFYSRIKRNFSDIRIVADQYGSSDFMQGFKDYIFEFNNLFNTVEFTPSQENHLLQIADMISGSIRRVYNQNDDIEVLQFIKYSSSPVEEWPPKVIDKIPLEELSENEQYDKLIRVVSINLARKFVEENLGSDDFEKHTQALALRYLILKYFENPFEYVYRIEIANYLTLVTGETFNEHSLSAKVISKVRDSNVIISSSEKGVKIPHNYQDILTWINRVNTLVVPYLQRVDNARDELLIASKSKLDILDTSKFPELKSYLLKASKFV